MDKHDINIQNMKESEYFPFIIKRTEKLSSALYMVTNFVSDTEPLKWRLRERSLSLLSDMTSISIKSVSDKAKLLIDTSELIGEIISLLEIAKSGSIISDMNVTVLQKEYKSLNSMIEHKEKIKDTVDEIMGEFFDDNVSLGDGNRNKDIYKGHSKGHKYKNSVPYKTDTPHGISPRIPLQKYSIKKDKASSVLLTKEERRNKILGLLKKLKEVTIKDVSSVIVGCSNKTIQRELSSLVKENVLKKEGEKRWSRYSLV